MYDTILISIVILFIYIFIFLNRHNVAYIESYKGDRYMVYKDEYQKEKSDMLAKILENMFILKNHLVNNINNLSEYSLYIKQLNDNFNENKTIVYETDPATDLTSYSVNKGEELSFCLKSKKNGKLHTMNLLMYVAIHEISHIACPEIGHGALFKKIFKKFADEATKIGIYKYEDYSATPVEYCGMILSSSIL